MINIPNSSFPQGEYSQEGEESQNQQSVCMYMGSRPSVDGVSGSKRRGADVIPPTPNNDVIQSDVGEVVSRS